MSDGDQNRPAAVAILICLVALTALAHANSLWNGFTWDDEYTVERNEALRDLANIPGFFADPSTGSASPNQIFYRPLRTSMHALVFATAGLDPLLYHAVNLVVHLANVILVFFISSRLVGSEWRGGTVAALFGTHPLTTEAVSNVTGLTDVLFAFFYLLALAIHLRRSKASRSIAILTVGVIGCCVLSLLSKEMAVTLPVMILLVDWANRSTSRRPGYIAYIAGLCLPCIAFVGIRSWLLGTVGQAAEFPGGTFTRTMLMQIEVVAKYLRLIVAPIGQSARHTTPIPTSVLDGSLIVSLIVVGAVTAFAIGRAGRDRRMTLGIAWFLVALLPVMNFVPIRGDLMGERFCYVPMIGILLCGVLLAGRSLTNRSTRVKACVLLAVLGSLATLTIIRSGVWRDNLRLFEDAVRISPRSNAVRVNLAREYEKRGMLEAAGEQYVAAAENTRRYYELYRELGDRQQARGDLREARIWFERALRMKEGDPYSIRSLRDIDRAGQP